MEPTAFALVLSLLAGSSIPIGASLANVRYILPQWLDTELRHTVTAFGGGALLSAIAFVLLPEAAERLAAWATILAFVLGGITFFAVDRALSARGGAGAQFLAMMLDYVPEAMALGALIAGKPEIAVLTAALIALQNLPESFSAYREIVDMDGARPWRVFALFLLMALVGPACALIGLYVLADVPAVLGLCMAFAAGGILYLVFQDVAPQARLEGHGAPPLGAVAGFALGLAGYLAVG